MRVPSLLRVAVALSLAACATRVPVAGVSPDAPDDPGPVAIRLFEPHGRTISFALSRPAYVAVFEIVPGQGVSLLYPAAYDDAATHPMNGGLSVALLPLYNLGRTFYLASFSRAAAQPVYLYAIASQSPLDIDEIARNPSALRRRIGVRAFAQGFSQQMMDRLDEAVVPEQADESWASDYLVLWPEVAPPPRMPQSLMVLCQDGSQILIDPFAAAIPAWCRVPRTRPTPPADSSRGPATPPSDSSKGGEPRGRPTEPEAQPGPPYKKGERPPAPRKNEGAEPGKRAPAPPTSVVVDYGTPRLVIDRSALERGLRSRSLAQGEESRWAGMARRESGYRADRPPRSDVESADRNAARRSGSSSMDARPAAPTRSDGPAAASAARPQPAPSRDPSPGGNTTRSDSPRSAGTQRQQ